MSDSASQLGGIEPYNARPLRAQVRECHFGFYSSDEVRALSTLSLTSVETFDDLGNPVPGGLNDPVLGPTSRGELCRTCGLDDKECTGHSSHIELPLPVYHPLLMNHCHLLLRSQCAHCSRLRLPENEKRAATCLLRLYRYGKWQEAQEFEAELVAAASGAKEEAAAAKAKASQIASKAKAKAAAARAAARKAKAEEQAAQGNGKKMAASLMSTEAMEVDFGSDDEDDDDDDDEEAGGDADENGNPRNTVTVLEVIEKQEASLTAAGLMKAATRGGGGGGSYSGQGIQRLPILSSHERALRHRYTKELMDRLKDQKKCGNCSGMSPTVRKDGFTKFFVKNMPSNWKAANLRLGLSTFDEPTNATVPGGAASNGGAPSGPGAKNSGDDSEDEVKPVSDSDDSSSSDSGSESDSDAGKKKKKAKKAKKKAAVTAQAQAKAKAAAAAKKAKDSKRLASRAVGASNMAAAELEEENAAASAAAQAKSGNASLSSAVSSAPLPPARQKFLPPSEVEHRLSTLWSFPNDASVLEELFGSMLHGDSNAPVQHQSSPASSGGGLAKKNRKNQGSQQQQLQQQLQLQEVEETKERERTAAAGAAEAFALTPGGPRGSGRETWRLFFVSVVHVPPPRFRPAAVIGGVTAENPQNAQLAKVMTTAAKIRDMQRSSSNFDNDGANGASAASSAAVAAPPSLAMGYGKDRLSLLIAAWIDMQIYVNGYMDASKGAGASNGQGGKADAPAFGIRQLLERKQGLFRMNMMGKRVNHACRSVISPDLNVKAGEIGMPVHFAKALSWPENVSVHNAAAMRLLVERGTSQYPGANWVRDANGRMINLERLKPAGRTSLAKRLLAGQGYTVGRHLVDGDYVVMNRQPTLHKPSLMSHQVRVLKYLPPTQQTLRMHYANCNSYNADFDGDEMNCHLPMSILAKAECAHIVHNSHQYIVPTDGGPVRGLIQDHVDAAVKLTQRDCFLPPELFLQLLTPAIYVLGTTHAQDLTISLPPPAILKPRKLYTGKQLFTAILALAVQHTVPATTRDDDQEAEVDDDAAAKSKHQNKSSSKKGKGDETTLKPRTKKPRGLSYTGKSKTQEWAYGAHNQETKVVWSNGYLCRGTIDKNAIGDASSSLFHAVFEVYGAPTLAALTDSIGRVLSLFLQYAGHSCGLADLVLTLPAERDRKKLLAEAEEFCATQAGEFLKERNAESAAKAAAVSKKKKGSSKGGDDMDGAGSGAGAAAAGAAGHNDSSNGSSHGQGAGSEDKHAAVRRGLGMLMGAGTDEAAGVCAALDSTLQASLAKPSSAAIKACLPSGLAFPTWSPGPNSGGKHANGFGLMVSTGAKGGAVNQSQVAVCLGQQALEGRRVPHMVSGKTLPSFRPWGHATDARAGGFVTNRFLTGLRPQEYYFHCMGGREGLVDTAVKTSRSGYLQRCLVKGLEELTVAYDHSVRDSAGNIVQFLYGEDGLDVTKAHYLNATDEKALAFVTGNVRTNPKPTSAASSSSQAPLLAVDKEAVAARAAHNKVRQWKDAWANYAKNNNSGSRKCKNNGRSHGSGSSLEVGSVVCARRLRTPGTGSGSSSWARGTLSSGWHHATVIAVHSSSSTKSSKKSSKKSAAGAGDSADDEGGETVDLRYDADGTVERAVPLSVFWPASAAQLSIAGAAAAVVVPGDKIGASDNSQAKGSSNQAVLAQLASQGTQVPLVLPPGHPLLPHAAQLPPPVSAGLAASLSAKTEVTSSSAASNAVASSTAGSSLRPHHDGVLSERMHEALTELECATASSAAPTPASTPASSGKSSKHSKSAAASAGAVQPPPPAIAPLRLAVESKWGQALAAPGEAVGCLAAQSVGEPSTQMTLNTFHLAGHGAANVTLGIPRLREILMTASANLKTPCMTAPLAHAKTAAGDASAVAAAAELASSSSSANAAAKVPGSKAAAHALARQVQKLKLDELLASNDSVEVSECVEPWASGGTEGGAGATYCRRYDVTVRLQPPHLIKRAFGVKWTTLAKKLRGDFHARLVKLVGQDLKKQGHKLMTDGMDDGMGDVSSSSDEEENGTRNDDEDDEYDDSMGAADDSEGGRKKKAGIKGKKHSSKGRSRGGGGAGEDDDEDDEVEVEDQAEGNEDDGSLAVKRKTKEASTYESDEEEDEDDDENDDVDDDDDDDDDEEGDGATKKSKKKSKSRSAASTTTPTKQKELSVSVGFSTSVKESKSDGTFKCTLYAPARAGRVLMVRLAEVAAAVTVVRAVPGIEKAHVVERELKLTTPYGSATKAERWALFTEGCNFQTLWALEADKGKSPDDDLLDLNRLGSNDIAAILRVYGVEAARRAIVQEVQGVFGVYGIDVDDRHVSLIADSMTFGGGFRPFNRIGIGDGSSSPFLHMSFETTASFLTSAAVAGEPDSLTSPSARLVMGQLAKQGTGAFEVRADLNQAPADKDAQLLMAQ